MANWNNLKASVAEVIKTNGNQEITGQTLQGALNSIISNLGENANFAGMATPTTNPGVPDGNVFYFATQTGVYANFGGIELSGALNILLYSKGVWSVINIITDILSKVNVLDFTGEGTTSITLKYYGIIAGHVYRIYPSNPNWDVSGISNYVMQIYYYDSNGEIEIVHSRISGNEGLPYYDIFIPLDAKISNGLCVYFRGAVDVKCSFYIYDITNISIIEIKAISVNRPNNLSVNDIYYNTNYNKLYSITTDGYQGYPISKDCIYRLGDEYFIYNGITLIGLNDWMINETKKSLSRIYTAITGGRTYVLNPSITEKELLCNIKIDISGSAEYYVTIVDPNDEETVIKSYTTENSDFKYNISYNHRIAIHFTSVSNGYLTAAIYRVFPSYSSIISKIDKKIDVNAIAYGYAYSDSNINLWEQGHFKDNGTKGDSNVQYYNLRIRLKDEISEKVEGIFINYGYKGKIYRYTKEGSFVDSFSNLIGDITFSFDFNNYTYRMDVGTISDSPIDISAYTNIIFLSSKIKSAYNKDVNWGIVPTEFYECKQTDFSFGEQSTLSSQIIAKFNELPLKKESIGTASDSSTMYMYKLTAPRSSLSGGVTKVKNTPKIIIVAGQHGFEKNAPYATYYFIKDLCENSSNSEIIRWLRANIDFIIIPCANPWGIDNSEYTNRNGVNLNRNWGVKNWAATVTDTDSEQYQGAAAFDQPETQCIRDVILNNKDATIIIDFHTNGQGVVTKNNINWISLQSPSFKDNYYDKLRDVAVSHLNNISSKLNIIYNEEIGGSNEDICGNITSNTPNNIGYLESYAVEQNFLGLTFEGCNGLPLENLILSDNVKKLNAELIGNFIITLAYHFKE